MIHARDFVDAALARGFDFYAGVPCSFLTPFINYVIGADGLDYVSAANEGDAVALAAGATIGGRRAVAMMQNSGLGNAVSPLTSLTYTFGIPLLVVCTHRGAPGVKDEPQHELMGQITTSLFDTMQVPWQAFPQHQDLISPTLDNIEAGFHNAPGAQALIMQKGTCEPFALEAAASLPRNVIGNISGSGHQLPAAQRQSRERVLGEVVARTPLLGSVVIASTGFSGRELFAIDDRSNHLYMVGSMGCASSLGLGLAMARPDLRVVVIDGDGAALMRMGNLATAGAYRPPNLLHLLLDNEVHDSTGAQATVSACVDFAAIAAACGYARVMRSDKLEDLAAFLNQTDRAASFCHFKIRAGARADLPRPDVKPAAVLRRLMTHIGSTL